MTAQTTLAEEETLRLIREALERARERVDYAISRLKSFEKIRALRWRCTQCGHVKRFTRPMPAEVAPPCPKCRSDSFAAAP
jgi:rubrerythrin